MILNWHKKWACLSGSILQGAFARGGALSELLYADELVLMSETIKALWNKFLKWKEGFES